MAPKAMVSRNSPVLCLIHTSQLTQHLGLLTAEALPFVFSFPHCLSLFL